MTADLATPWLHLVAVIGLGAMCGTWVLAKRLARFTDAAPTLDDGCHDCGACAIADACRPEQERGLRVLQR